MKSSVVNKNKPITQLSSESTTEIIKVTGTDLNGEQHTLERSKPYQLSLFQMFIPQEDKYSNSIELYDIMPKYFASTKEMAAMRRKTDIGEFLPVLRRRFKDNGQEYIIEINAGRVVRENEYIVESYPTEREQLLEEVLRKIACDSLNGCFLDGKAGVQFSLNQLIKELEARGHSIKYQALIEALTICNTATIKVKTVDGKSIISAPIFPVLLTTKRCEWEKYPKDTRCYVQFNPLVTESIRTLTYRQLDYLKFMGFKRHLTRWLYKRLSHRFTNAGFGETYTILASTIIRDSGLVNRKQIRDSIKAIDDTLGELKTNNVLLKIEKHIQLKDRAIADAKYTLEAFVPFIEEMKKANKRHREVIGEAQDAHKLSHSIEQSKIKYLVTA